MPSSGTLVTEAQDHIRPFVFVVPIAPIRRIIGLVMAGFFLIPATILGWLLVAKGATTELDGILIWALCGILVLASGFFLWLSFPRFKSAAQLEFRRNSIRFISAPIDRLLYDVVDSPIQSDATGILLRYRPGRYKLLIQTKSSGEHDTGIALLTELSARDASELTNGISVATGLPAQMVTACRLPDGRVEDSPWKPRSASAGWGTLGKLTFGTVPLWAGAIAGCLSPSISVIGGVGLMLWVVETLALLAYAFLGARQRKFPWLYWLSSIFTFGTIYMAIAAFVSFEFHKH